MKKLTTFHTTFETYFATEIVGEGGSGRVYKVTNASGETFALKLLDARNSSREKLKRFKNELFFSLKNKHPNIISVVDHGVFIDSKGDSPFYVMPLYAKSLRTLVTARTSVDRVLGYFGQVLDGVEAAHLQGVIHRDLKPENILFDPSADRLVVADFGIARFQEEILYTSVETSPHARLANFQYAAPEQRGKGLEVDQRADIYALGLILNEMYTGEVPLGTGYKTIATVALEYGYLDEIVSTMLRQSPQDRSASIEVVKRQLIGYSHEFIVRQRLSELKQIVVPVTDIDDPLILDPPRLVNVDYVNGMLTLFFQRPVNEMWKWALNNMGSHSAVMGKGPEDFQVTQNQAHIRADERQVQAIIDYFKSWLPNINRVYAERIQREKSASEERQREQLRLDIEEQERRQRVLQTVRI